MCVTGNGNSSAAVGAAPDVRYRKTVTQVREVGSGYQFFFRGIRNGEASPVRERLHISWKPTQIILLLASTHVYPLGETTHGVSIPLVHIHRCFCP